MTLNEAKEIIQQFNKGYGFSDNDILFVRLLRKEGLNDFQIAAVIRTMETTCKYCFDNGPGCQCWNDE